MDYQRSMLFIGMLLGVEGINEPSCGKSALYASPARR